MPPIVQHRNRTVRVTQTPVVENNLADTFLSADSAAGSGTITVKNINGYAVGKYIWFNPYSETSEIVAVHASSAPSGTTITLASNTTYAHSAGEKVYYIEFNQVEISVASTLTGSKTVLATKSLLADQQVLQYLDVSVSTGYYFARFKDSVASTFGSYSDGVAYGGFASNTVGYMIDRALSNLELELSEKITLRDCYSFVNDCLKLVQGKLKRWPEHYSYNAILGQVSRGVNTITMPTDAYDTETNKSIIGFRIGTGKNLQYLSPGDFDNQLNLPGGNGAVKNTVRTQAVATDTSLAITNSYDFADSGSVDVYVSGTKYNITYTGVTRDTSSGGTGALTGIPASGTGAITVTIPAGTNVWQNEIEGQPFWFTVRNGSLEWYPLADSSYDNTNAYGDYALVATEVDSEGDTIDFQRFDMVLHYVTWRIKMKARNNGELDQNDGYFLQFKERLNDAIRTLPGNNLFRIRPAINRISNRRNLPRVADIQDLSIDDQ